MIGKLHAYLEQRREGHRLRRKQKRNFERWLAAHPGGSCGQFYAEDARRRIDAGDAHATLGLASVDQAAVMARAQRVLADFKRAGCAPHHVVVDYGCGSLWIGEALMDYLEPGNYIGLDVSDVFYAEGLARLSSEFVAGRRPTLHTITDAALREVRGRKPDFIASIAVMQHVPPKDLPGYFARIVSLAGPETRIEICHGVGFWTKWRAPRSWRHGRFSVRSALAPLGYAADYRPENRIMRTTPGFSLVRR
jgi:cyclopropane fatty-acyl-phospholipid synthase-like methyltransferase